MQSFLFHLYVMLTLLGLAWGTRFVKTNIEGLGTCQGLQQNVLGKSVDVFKGIPYAKPPVGELRFKPPEPISWTGFYNATTFGAMCPQMWNPSIMGNEDCLTLNIYKPSKAPGKMAVMVWIHGVSFVSGSGQFYDGSVLAVEYNVTVVTINYRLGILGFFNDPGAETTGNYGLLDQIAALRWVKKHISSFNGDPYRVTIFGQGAGAASVSLHTFSPLIRKENLFQRAIMQSGAASCPWAACKTKTKEHAKKFGALLDCEGAWGLGTITQCLKRKEVHQILTAQVTLLRTSPLVAPTVDGSYLKELPWQLEMTDAVQATPVEQMIGFNNDEGTVQVGTLNGKPITVFISPLSMNRTILDDTIKYATAERYSCKQSIFHTITAYEYTKSSPSDLSLKWFESTSDFIGDYYMSNNIRNLSEVLARSGITIYRYKFSYFPKNTPLRWKVSHASEIAFVFGTPLKDKTSYFVSKYTEKDITISRNIMKMWTDFAKTGNPRNNWPKFTTTKKEYMEIGLNFTVMQGLGSKRMIFWNEIVPQLTRTALHCKNSGEKLGVSSTLLLYVLICVKTLTF